VLSVSKPEPRRLSSNICASKEDKTLVYGSGIPTLRSSAHRVKLAPKNRFKQDDKLDLDYGFQVSRCPRFALPGIHEDSYPYIYFVLFISKVKHIILKLP
jgi:hypothetical protein